MSNPTLSKPASASTKSNTSAVSDVGLIGLAVMGENLALNIESRGYPISVYNRTTSKVDDFLKGPANGKKVTGTRSPEEFVASIKRPRKIIIMVKAGKAVFETVRQLLPLLEPGDVIMDGGNSLFTDSELLAAEVEAKGIHFLGTGISGGEEGALKGPSIMPGGTKQAYEILGPILNKISAKVDGDDCCAYIGKGGAGHFVKMVHNGIEYGDMQLICEAYNILRHGLGLSVEELQQTFTEWNKGDLDSFLIEITSKILGFKDSATGKPMVDVIQDKAGQKGTGKWTIISALDFGIPVSTMSEAVFARCISALKSERVEAAKILKGPSAKIQKDKKAFIEAVRDSLYASKVCSYAQGFALMSAVSKDKGWDLNLGSCAMIWRGGCIIRARFLQRIKDAYDKNSKLANLLLDPYFSEVLTRTQANWRQVVSESALAGIPTPTFSASLAYYDSYRSERLPANLLQAQRDYFGSHTYERIDQPAGKFFHLDWVGDKKQYEA
jgi:6-phosphogluconate dehydrogenase